VFEGALEKLDGDGKPTSRTDVAARFEARGADRRTQFLRYVEDGEDKRVEAQERADKRRREAKKKSDGRALVLPFLEDEQPRYAFTAEERDGDRVRVSFRPRGSAKEGDSEGEAWLSAESGRILTMGIRPLKLPMFVRWINVKLTFAAPTDRGFALSAVSAEGEAGVLFLRTRFRAQATVRDYSFP
jgi:hypothetical protein